LPGAIVVAGFDIGNDGPVGDFTRDRVDAGLMSLPGDQVEVTHHGGAELRMQEIVARGEMLGVVPQRGYGVAVVVAHVLALGQPVPLVLSANLSSRPP